MLKYFLLLSIYIKNLIAYCKMEANITILFLDVVFNGQHLFYKNTYSMKKKYVITQFEAR